MLKTEVEEAIKLFRNNKATGIDWIPVEYIKLTGEPRIDITWKTGKFAKGWRKSIYKPPFKKGKKTQCKNFLSFHM